MDPSNYSQCVSQNYAKITKIMNTTIEKLNEIQKGKDNLGVSDYFKFDITLFFYTKILMFHGKNPQFQILQIQ